jgi:hypothetical protein
MEHRCGQRFRLGASASVTDGFRWTAFARVRDISASGAFIECLSPRATVTHVIVLIKARQMSTVVAGDVIRRARDGIGIEWGEFAPTAVAPLLNVAARLLDGAGFDGARLDGARRRTASARSASRVGRVAPHRAGSQRRTLDWRNGRAPRT